MLEAQESSHSESVGAKTRPCRTVRIGVIASGQSIRDYVAKPGRSVKVGTTASCDVVLDGDGDQGFTILAVRTRPARFVLELGPRLTADVSQGHDDVRTFSGPCKVALEDSARGRVRVGQQSVLFQLVDAPEQVRPHLPPSVARGMFEVDWRFTIIAAFSFLLHFGGVGMLYTDWLDPAIEDPGIVAALVDSIARQVPPPPRPETVERDDEGQSTPVAGHKPQGSNGRSTHGRRGPAAAEGEASMDGVIRELESIDVGVVAAVNDFAQHSATRDVLDGDAATTLTLEQLARANVGIGPAPFSFGSSIHPMDSVRGGPGLEAIPRTRREEKAHAGVAERVAGPRPVGNVSAPPKVTGDVPNAGAVVAGLRAGFRRCYELGLIKDPSMSGGVRITAQIGPNGDVVSVGFSPTGTISPAVASCVAARVRAAQFDAPASGIAVVAIPVTLTPQAR